MNEQTTSAGIGGAVSGATTGATIGSLAGPAGTAVGGIIGAVAGGVASALKSKGDQKAREKEIQRLQQREDTAIQRATEDSLRAGVDPRSMDKGVNPASSAPVEPYQAENPLESMQSAFNSASNVLNNRYINEARIQDSAINALNEAYKERKVAAQNGLQETDALIERWHNDMKATEVNESTASIEQTKKYTTTINSLTRSLSTAKVDNETYNKVINLVVNKNGSKDSTTTSFGGGGDIASTITGVVDNIVDSITENKSTAGTSTTTGNQKVSSPAPMQKSDKPTITSYDTKGGQYGNFGFKDTNGKPIITDKKGNPIPKDLIKSDKPAPTRQHTNTKSESTTTKSETTERKQDEVKRGDQNKTEKGKKFRLSGEYSDTDENWQTSETGTTGETGGRKLRSFSAEQVTEIVNSYIAETIRNDKLANRKETINYDYESKQAQLFNLTRLEVRRMMLMREYTQSPLDFFNENYQPAYDFYKHIYSPYKLFRK